MAAKSEKGKGTPKKSASRLQTNPQKRLHPNQNSERTRMMRKLMN